MLNPIDYSISKFISYADDKTISDIREIAEAKHFKKGAIIETRGETVDHLYLIDEGLVQLGIDGIDGSRFNLTRLGSGHTFGETAYFLDQSVMYDSHAESDVLLQKLSRANIDYLMTHSLIFSKALMAVSCMRVRTILSYIGDTLGMPLQARVAKQILSVSESAREGNIVRIRQVDLAHSLGVSRVSIGKAVKALAAKELIKLGYGKFEILSRADLEKLVKDGQRQL